MEDGMKKAVRGKKMKAPLPGSEEAKRVTAVILEVISGERGPQSAAEVLGISSMRYYALEDRALRGMVQALEPRPRGRKVVSPEDALAKVEKERVVLKRELGRAQALLRLVRKSVKLGSPEPAKGKRRRRVTGRAGKLVERLKASVPTVETAEA